MSSDWVVVINFALIFLVTFVAKFIKEKLGIFRTIIVPTAFGRFYRSIHRAGSNGIDKI